jgi:hypothetical protein
MKRVLVVLLLSTATTSCGAGTPGVRSDCPAGQTSLDGTCVSQPIADYVACIRATGATVASNSSKALSAAAGVAGVTASTKAEVEDKLEKTYAKESDANALEIIHDCRTKTSPSSAVEVAGAESDPAKGAVPASSESAASPAGRWQVPGGSPGATVVQEGSHLSVYIEGAPSVGYGTVSGKSLDVQFKWVPNCCTGTMAPDGKAIYWSNNSVWHRF